MNGIDFSRIPHLRFAGVIKDIKARLPRTCTFLSPIKTIKGELQVRAVINNSEYRFLTPENLDFSKADIKRLENLLLEKC